MKKLYCTFADFQKIDIRIGEIISAKPLKGSRNLLELLIDLGPDYGKVEILSGIAQWYEPEKLISKKFMFVANLEPKKMMGKISNGMIMAADHLGKAKLIAISKTIPNGTLIR